MRKRPEAVTVREAGGVTFIEVRPPAAAGRIAILVLAGIWAAFTVAWGVIAAASRAPLAFAVGALPFAAVGLVVAGRTMANLPSRARLTIDRQRGLVADTGRALFGGICGRSGARSAEVPLDEVGVSRIAIAPGAGGLMRPVLAVEAGAVTLRLGEGLGSADLRRLADAVAAALTRARAPSSDDAAPPGEAAP